MEFIRTINQQVTDFDVVISTPSMATGVSIEVEHFDKVYGLFTGVLSDGDIAQALARVRPQIPRVVWCANHGKNFSRVSRSEYPVRVKQAIQTQWDRENPADSHQPQTGYQSDCGGGIQLAGQSSPDPLVSDCGPHQPGRCGIYGSI